MEILMKLFYSGLFVGIIIGETIISVITLVILEIEERRADD